MTRPSRSELELENDRLRDALALAQEELRALRRPTILVRDAGLHVQESTPSNPPASPPVPLYGWSGPYVGPQGERCTGAKCGGSGRFYRTIMEMQCQICQGQGSVG